MRQKWPATLHNEMIEKKKRLKLEQKEYTQKMYNIKIWIEQTKNVFDSLFLLKTMGENGRFSTIGEIDRFWLEISMNQLRKIPTLIRNERDVE